MSEVDSQELSEYIRRVVQGIDNGLSNTEFKISNEDKIVLEISLINTKKNENGLKIYVANVKSKCNKEELSKITIPIRIKKYFNPHIC